MDNRLLQMIELTNFEALFKKLGYAYFTTGDYNLNIIGIRNLIDGIVQKNDFNDVLLVTYKVNGVWKKHIWQISTDPGLTSLKAPSNSKGCAILVPSQYRSVYSIDLHQGKYKALCLRLGNVAVYRDGNKDNVLNMDPRNIEQGMFGINIHKAGENSELVNGWSAGCQVFKKAAEFNTFMQIVNKSAELYGNKFTYTLITSDWLTKCVC